MFWTSEKQDVVTILLSCGYRYSLLIVLFIVVLSMRKIIFALERIEVPSMELAQVVQKNG